MKRQVSLQHNSQSDANGTLRATDVAHLARAEPSGAWSQVQRLPTAVAAATTKMTSKRTAIISRAIRVHCPTHSRRSSSRTPIDTYASVSHLGPQIEVGSVTHTHILMPSHSNSCMQIISFTISFCICRQWVWEREIEYWCCLLLAFSLSHHFQVLCQSRTTCTSGGAAAQQQQQQSVLGLPIARVAGIRLDTAAVSGGCWLFELYSRSKKAMPHDDSRRAHYRWTNYRATAVQRSAIHTPLAACLLIVSW